MQVQERIERPAARLADRVAIVTGAGSGIGAAIVHRFVQEGASVLAVDIKEERLAQYLDAENVAVLTADVTSGADADRMVTAAIERFGKLDLIVNNAGIVDAFLPVGEMTDEMWNRVLDVNLTGPMMVCRAGVKTMLEQGGGVIVNVASIGGLLGGRAGAAYTASKHGLIGLTRNIAATYLKDGIRCNAICSGGVDTGIPLGGEPSKRGYETLSRTLATSPRVGKPEEIAAVAAFLASDEASFINGAVLVADGGWTAA